jgi:thiol-disulfide isomerase/thioredoxin
MVGVSVLVVLQSLLGAEPVSYHAAFKDAQAKERPLLVLVGAPWCPGCRTMKQTVLPNLAKRGGLDSVSFAAVDLEVEPEMANSLMRGNGLPQLIIFTKQSGGQWHREQITGSVGEPDVQALIARALAAQKETPVAGGGGGD